MPADIVRRRVVVSGRVQGVFFRESVRERAEKHHLAGWVRNRSDGTVEAVFEGAQADVEALVRFCESGPPHARVDSVEVHEEEPSAETGFRVS